MSENKTIYRRILKDYFENDDETVLEELYAANHVNHFLGVNGAQAWKQFMVPFREGFPDLHFIRLCTISRLTS